MGKITQQETTSPKTHFSHPHPLKITSCHQAQNLASSSCPACNLNPSGTIYSCTPCNFFLHEKCFEMPMKITHPFHKDHTFTLLPKPAYAEGLFSCDACGEPGNGFSYNCKPCGVDLHVPCASMPLSVTRACHMHELRLAFGIPYGDKSYYCDVCKGPGGSGHWLYRCGPCGFDAHLNCALRFQVSTVGNSSTRSAPAPPPTQGFRTQFLNNAAIGVPAGGAVSVPPGLAAKREEVFRMIDMIKNNNARALTSGGCDGSYRVLRQQQLMQMLSNFRNGGAGGGSGGGGGVPGLNGMGNGGGGQDFWQGLMGGGGGGGVPGLNGMGNGASGQDFLQGLMGGGGGGGVPGLGGLGGGGGGQDFLQVLMNGNGGGGLDIQSLLGGGNGLDFMGGALGGFGF